MIYLPVVTVILHFNGFRLTSIICANFCSKLMILFFLFMKKRVFIIQGLVFIVVGAIFLINSFSGITGAVVLENVNVSVSAVVGLVFVIVGILIFMARPPLDYERIAVRLYDSLGAKNAYGHHTEPIEKIKNLAAAEGSITPRQVGIVIKEEIKKGRLSQDKNSLSIPMKREKLEESEEE